MPEIDNANAPQIGPIIQRQRKLRGLTLAQFAAMSGVSRSMLSLIERGQANPTFAVLWSMTRALKIDIADLVEERAPAPEVGSIEITTASHTPEIRSADGLCRLRILSPPGLAGSIEWYDVEVAPSGILDSAPHAPGAFEHFTALSAGFEITSGSVSRTLGIGETARYPADVPHRIANLSSEAIRGLMVLLYNKQ